jgi:hypothetical protein
MVDLSDYFNLFVFENAINYYALINLLLFIVLLHFSTGSIGIKTIILYINDILKINYEITYSQPKEGYKTVNYDKYFQVQII